MPVFSNILGQGHHIQRIVFSLSSPVSVSSRAIACCRACKSTPRICISAFHEKGRLCQAWRENLEGQPSFHPGSLSGPFCLTSERALSPYGLKDQAENTGCVHPFISS